MEQFDHVKNLDIHSSCRTCLENTNKTLYNIFETQDLERKFTVCTSLPVEPGDGYPTSLCESCHTKIHDFYNFQQMCISARKRFQDFINPDNKPFRSLLAAADSSKLSSSLLELAEPKDEKEDNLLPNDECSDDVEADLLTVRSQGESCFVEQGEESDDDQPIAKYRVDNKDISNKNSILIENEGTPDDLNIGDSQNKNSSSSTKTNFECEICKKSFKKHETFEVHMRVHKGLKPYPCQQCDKSYARPGRLKVHIRVKHEGKPEDRFPCTEMGCDKIMCSKQTLRQHIAEIHCDTDGNSCIKTKPLYICEECGMVLKGLSTLKNHRFLHSGQPRPHACSQCHKRYMTKCKLKEHMNRHAGIKNFVCPHCGAKKSSRSELKNHVNYHTKEKTYPCHICNMVFNNIVNFNRHKRVVHEGIKNFPCSYCDRSFGKAETRKHHEMTHTGEKPHECNICHKKFIQVVSLKKHQKVHLKALANGE